MDVARFPWQQLGMLLVEQGLLTETQLEHALAEQRRSGRLLGRIMVDSGYITPLDLARGLTEQHGVELRAANSSQAPLASADRPDAPTGSRAWRPLGKVLVENRFVAPAELEEALGVKRRHPDRRLGEMLVERGYLTGSALARALAEQHGVALETQLDDVIEASVKPPVTDEPVYRVSEPGTRSPSLHESANFLEAADFAFEYIERQKPAALEIQCVDGGSRETIWTYSESRAAAEAAARKGLVETFGFDPASWDAGSRLGRG